MSIETPPVCDYEGSDYRTRFWEGQGRDYEDRVERVALRRLMPPTGSTLIEIGAGFGRLADEYRGYEKVVLFDYSRSLLREAQAHLGDDPRFVYVAGNWYQMPFVAGLFETLVQIRTLHHAADAPALFRQLARIARPDGQYILEFANKQNLKAILRYALRRQEWSPFSSEPVEFVALNFDFHPRWIRQQLRQVQFAPGRMLTVSHFRFEPLKKRLPTSLLARLDSMAQLTGNWWQLSPSVFVCSAHPAVGETAVPHTFFACPHCQTPLGEVKNGRLHCPNSACQKQWQVEDGLYDFKEPVS
ncbi:MAG: class I SAM-dependent methyltransferase [Ardenticatenaceae bacterium]|nr:class I SAM-dependent methyltransferase [Anaerolineales bacterium]MCB8921295.1 class I SAM-dependent methyltransferase [Ardenticatenaceae bacterium]MCB8990661.1 class I SAM-dependent methyltransferase [Ardenticatenaceae bacterium]